MEIGRLPEFFRETHTIGRDCREHMLDRAHFPVLGKAPFVWVGYSVLRAPYHMVRLRSVHSHVVAAVAGRGRALVSGELVDWKPGRVLLGPVGAHHAFEVAGPGPWTLAWVFFDDRESAPVLRGPRAELVEADAEDFVATLRVLVREAAGAAHPAMLESLVTVLDTTARRLAGSERVDERLWKLWAAVEADLAGDWTLAGLARLAGLSEESLRRLCQRHYQRSPMNHLTQLRLRRAGTMLRASPAKLAEIAECVGYASPYSFSVAFRRWSGVSPGRFRRDEAPARCGRAE